MRIITTIVSVLAASFVAAIAVPQFAKAAPPVKSEKAKAYELLTPASKKKLKEDHTLVKFADGTTVSIHKDLITTRKENSGLVVHFVDMTWRLKDGTVKLSTMAYTGCDKGKGYMARVVNGTVTDRQMPWSRENADKKDGALDLIAVEVCLNVLQIAYEGLDD